MLFRLVSLLLFCWAGVVSAAPVDLKIMSFNLRYGTAKDGENAWPKRCDIVVDTIRAQAPDLIGSQECLDFQAEYIVEKLPEYAWFGVSRKQSMKDEMAAVFYRKSLLVPIEAETFWLSETPEVVESKSWDSSLPRTATRIRFYHRESRGFFTFFNTHLDHMGVEARKKGAELIVSRAAALPADMPVIVTGDFNCFGGNSVPWQTFVDGGFQDAWQLAKERSGPDVTFHDFSGKPGVGADGRIDWIMIRGAAEVAVCETLTTNKDGRYPSDHFPVRAQIKLELADK